ncbi:MAG: LapA family protein [Thermodesulfovibrionales bacterium]
MAILIVLLILMTTVAVFAIQNAMPVTISFILWRFESSLAVVIFVSLICGSVMTVLAYTMSRIKTSINRAKAEKIPDEKTQTNEENKQIGQS